MKAFLLPALLMSMSASLLAKEVGLLGDHLVIDLPDEAKPGVRSTDMMGPMPGTDETLYWIGDDDNRVAVFAKELIKFAEPDFIEKAADGLRRSHSKDFEIRTVGDNIVYSLATKAAFWPTGADCYGVAYVRSDDGMVQSVAFHFAKKAAKDIEACRELIIKAVGSIKTGAGKPDLGAHTATIGKEWNVGLQVPVPAGYFFIHEPGADFNLYRFKEVRQPGSGGSGIGIYLGHHPGKTEMDDCKDLRDGKVLGKDVKWCHFPSQSAREYDRAEVLVPLGEGVYMHLFLHADSPEKLAALISAAEGITLKDKAE